MYVCLYVYMQMYIREGACSPNQSKAPSHVFLTRHDASDHSSATRVAAHNALTGLKHVVKLQFKAIAEWDNDFNILQPSKNIQKHPKPWVPPIFQTKSNKK